MKNWSYALGFTMVLTMGCGPSTSDFIGTYNMNYTTKVTIGEQEFPSETIGQLVITEGHHADMVVHDAFCAMAADLDAEGFSIARTSCGWTDSFGRFDVTVNGDGTLSSSDRLNLVTRGQGTITRPDGSTAPVTFRSTAKGRRI